MHLGKHYKAPCAALCPDANSYSHIYRLCYRLDVQQSRGLIVATNQLLRLVTWWECRRCRLNGFYVMQEKGSTLIWVDDRCVLINFILQWGCCCDLGCIEASPVLPFMPAHLDVGLVQYKNNQLWSLRKIHWKLLQALTKVLLMPLCIVIYCVCIYIRMAFIFIYIQYVYNWFLHSVSRAFLLGKLRFLSQPELQPDKLTSRSSLQTWRFGIKQSLSVWPWGEFISQLLQEVFDPFPQK